MKDTAGILLTPGPTPLPPAVLKALKRQVIHHRSTSFKKIFEELLEYLKYVFATSGDVFVISGSGTSAMEFAVTNFIAEKKNILVASTGYFGDRWAQMLNSYGVNFIYERFPDGFSVDFEKIADIIKKNSIDIAFFTHVETSTATLNDVKKIKELKGIRDFIAIVDAVSSLAGEEFFMDKWDIDVCVSASQKGLMNTPGLSFVAANKKAIESSKNRTIKNFYLSIDRYISAIKNNETPFTPPVSLIVAQIEALKIIKNKGIENVVKENIAKALYTRNFFRKNGFKLFSNNPSNILTAIYADNLDASYIVNTLRERYGVYIAGGQGNLKGKILRFAHMGYIRMKDIKRGLNAFMKVIDA